MNEKWLGVLLGSLFLLAVVGIVGSVPKKPVIDDTIQPVIWESDGNHYLI